MAALRLTCLAATALFPVAVTAADKPPPPRAKNVEVSVMRGGSVRIPLRGHERNLNSLRYATIGSPRHGSLSAVEQYEGPESQGPGHVVYTHGDDEDSTADSFAFEVRASATNLRGRGRVDIRIVDAPARLQVSPAALDFGETAIGDRPVRRELELANAGGGILQGVLDLPAPFLLEGDGNFVLGRGERWRIPVLFAPQRPGAYVFRVQPLPGDPAVLSLRGEALSPFSVEVADGRFELQPDGSRSAKAVARNASGQEQTIAVVLPLDSPVESSGLLPLAPGAKGEITLRIPAEHKAALREFEVRFEGVGHAQVHRFGAPAVPASLAVVSGPDFGRVRSGTVARADLVLRNEGGTAAEARFPAHDSIRPADGTTTVTLPPGEELAVPLKLTLKKNQRPPAEFAVLFQGDEVPVPVKAEALAAPSPRPASTPAPAPAHAPAPAPAPAWTLNDDVAYVAPPAGPTLRWREKAGWGNVELHHRPAGSGRSWQRYGAAARTEGFAAWLASLFRTAKTFLAAEIERPDIDESRAGEPAWNSERIAEADMADGVWRLSASREGEAARDVTVPFRISGDRLVAAEEATLPASKAAQEKTGQAPAAEDKKIRPPGPETPLASAGIKADRRTALLQVAFAPELGVRSFRLEQGAMVSAIDPASGIPGPPAFQKIQNSDAPVELLGLTEVAAEGGKFTVGMARIGGLSPGTRTYWRVVPAGISGDLPPTAVVLVDTEPLPPFPWDKALLAVLFALLAGVVWLRWRSRRVPA